MYIDIAVGLIIGWLVSLGAGEPQVPLIFFGILATLAPDLDFIIWLARNKWQINQFAHEHRDIFHLPLPIGIGGACLIALIDPLYGLVWFLGTTAHFVHDTLAGGWGIQWLYPLYLGYFTLVPYSPKRYIRDRAEQRELAITHGTAHWTDWKEGTPRNIFRFLVSVGVLVSVVIVFCYWLLAR